MDFQCWTVLGNAKNQQLDRWPKPLSILCDADYQFSLPERRLAFSPCPTKTCEAGRGGQSCRVGLCNIPA